MFLYICALALSIAYLSAYAVYSGRSHRGGAVAGAALLVVMELAMAAAILLSELN